MTEQEYKDIKSTINFHCNESYKYLIDYLENLNITVKQQKSIKDSFDNLNLNIQLDIDKIYKNHESKQIIFSNSNSILST